MAELYSILDANIETNVRKPIIIYNADHSYDAFLSYLKQKQENGFVRSSIFDAFDICASEEEVFERLDMSEKIEGRSK